MGQTYFWYFSILVHRPTSFIISNFASQLIFLIPTTPLLQIKKRKKERKKANNGSQVNNNPVNNSMGNALEDI